MNSYVSTYCIACFILFKVSTRFVYLNIISNSCFSRIVPNFFCNIYLSFCTRDLSCIKYVIDFHNARSSTFEITPSASANVKASSIRSSRKMRLLFVFSGCDMIEF